MTLKNQAALKQNASCQLLYNPELLRAALVEEKGPGLLSRQLLTLAQDVQPISSGGRGQAWFLQVEGLHGVLRAYQRGGLIAKLNRQTYLGLSAEGSRAFKEWRLLQWMLNQDLPVPRPIAASVCRWPFSLSPLYRAHILVQRIADTQTLDQVLRTQALDEAGWRSIGQCIRRFHDKGVYHADLNANNILLNENKHIFLIDFDKGERRNQQQADTPWKKDNLQRLKRSLIKLQGMQTPYYFSDQLWQALESAYYEFQAKPE